MLIIDEKRQSRKHVTHLLTGELFEELDWEVPARQTFINWMFMGCFFGLIYITILIIIVYLRILKCNILNVSCFNKLWSLYLDYLTPPIKNN